MAVAMLLQPAWMRGLGQWTTAAVGWIGLPVLWLASGLLVLAAVLIFSPAGSYRLGSKAERPAFSRLAWLAMLFAAGMGSGLVFWGVAEPISHLAAFPADQLQPGRALAITWYHWGFHAWAIYAFAGLTVAWFGFRLGHRSTTGAPIQALTASLLGARGNHALGRGADFLAMLAVVFGVAGSLANGVHLLGTGLGNQGLGMRLAALGLLMICFLISALTGLHRGIRVLSLVNVGLALVLAGFLLLVSDGQAVLQHGLAGAGDFLRSLPAWSVQLIDNPANGDWARDWTLIYLLWWIAWTPFVGVFIARISRGRTVREFLLGVILVPSVVSILWFTILGGGALGFDEASGGQLGTAVQQDYTQALFSWLGALPLAEFTPWLVMLLLFVFLITSADSAAYVLGMLAERGRQQPAIRSRISWGLLTALAAAGLLVHDDVDLNKSVAIAGALPFAVILLIQVISLLRSLFRD